MISRTNETKIRFLLYAVGTILFFDLMTIVTNLFVSPVLDGVGLPDIFIYIKTGAFFVIFLLLNIWLKDPNYSLSKSRLRMLLTLGLYVLIVYFIAIYMYKYFLIGDTASIIRNQILNGNPALVYDLSAINYKSLTYIMTIFGGFNSEFILFIEALIFQSMLIGTKSLDVEDETDILYDVFMFDAKLFPVSFLHTILVFISINLLTFRYTSLYAIEMGIALVAFIFALMSLVTSYEIFKMKNNYCKRSAFVGAHRFLIFTGIASVSALAILAGFNIYLFMVDQGTYRIISSILSIATASYLLIRAVTILKLENK